MVFRTSFKVLCNMSSWNKTVWSMESEIMIHSGTLTYLKACCVLFFKDTVRSVYKELHADRETGC